MFQKHLKKSHSKLLNDKTGTMTKNALTRGQEKKLTFNYYNLSHKYITPKKN